MTSDPGQNSENLGGAPVRFVVPAGLMKGDDDEDQILLQEMLERAKTYLRSFSWCSEILDSYFGGGVGGVLAIFLFKVTSPRWDVDPWMWVAVGDIPPAYLPLEDAESPTEVLEIYIDAMNRWVKAAKEGRETVSDPDIPPVNVPATPEWAEQLDRRLKTLPDLIKPYLRDSGSDS